MLQQPPTDSPLACPDRVKLDLFFRVRGWSVPLCVLRSCQSFLPGCVMTIFHYFLADGWVLWVIRNPSQYRYRIESDNGSRSFAHSPFSPIHFRRQGTQFRKNKSNLHFRRLLGSNARASAVRISMNLRSGHEKKLITRTRNFGITYHNSKRSR